ncbi:multiheme c-type cytochrome [Limnoglobus roseus]|uniref:Cytochrome c-552/4 domain-containing protein n=1 Tax=Limnoglobus roseus TaxID=2598579 RepID=A0A5C1AJ00_9BACT|nr:multiheme c-type cytochrome [Limnoglobus roseus]QEL16948.1 hypothetical protein PX52LOC_03924 [Limnoglobus roseus]
MGLRAAALFAGLAASVTLVTYAAQRDRLEPPRGEPVGARPAQGLFTPTVGCSAASCHGSGMPGKPGGEHSTWIESDPHTKAFQVLRNEDSVRISKNLGRTMPAHEDASCLKCHAVNEDRYFHGEKLDERELNEGVSCDGCHGPSAKWNSLHYTGFWKTLSDRQKFEEFGFVPTKDPVARILTCAQCHVGGRDREVNHDLIAAGHPRLSFEYTRFHYSEEYQQKHWVEKTPNPDFEVRTWLIGQVATLRAAVDLLAARADRADVAQSPWPEFAESSCYACHQNLGPELRSNTTKTLHPRKPGALGWQLWYSSFAKVLPKLASVVQPNGTAPALTSLDALRAEMEKPTPNAKTISALARTALVELDASLLSFQQGTFATNLNDQQVRTMAATITESVYDTASGKLRDYDWDVLAQHGLALTALYHGAGGTGNPTVAGWKEPLLDVRSKLAFPTTGSRVDSPRDFKPDSVYASFRTLYELTH